MLYERLAKKIIHQYGSPIVVYEEKKIKENYRELEKSLPLNSKIVYSVKANPNPKVIKMLFECGAFFETASEGEYHLLRSIEIPSSRILFSGQAKTERGIRRAVQEDVLLFNIESYREAILLKNIAHELKTNVRFLVRINPSAPDNRAMLKMGGVPSPFGVDEEGVYRIIIETNNTNANLLGFFMYNGSQYYDYKDIYNNTCYLLEYARKIDSEFGIKVQFLDFGGGFSVVENETQLPLNLKKLKHDFDKIQNSFDNLKMSFFESGRYLVSNTGVLVSSVIDTKISKGKHFVVLDAGINNIGIKQLCYRRYNPFIVSYTQGRNLMRQTLVGPTCTTIDNVCSDLLIDELFPGDLIGILECGAYLLSYSPINFCGHPIPAEVMIMEDNSIQLIRERGSIDSACGQGFIK